jgi:hypothetical protein
VVFRNELLEVIQYAPTRDQVHALPIVIIAPWINKYYILDLTPRKSMVRYLLDHGFSVFVTSSKNPTAELSHITFDDYMADRIHRCRTPATCPQSLCGWEKSAPGTESDRHARHAAPLAPRTGGQQLDLH